MSQEETGKESQPIYTDNIDVAIQHIERNYAKLDTLRLSQVDATRRGVSPEQVRKQLCQVWSIAGPAVHALATIPLIPVQFRQALRALASGLDLVCAQPFNEAAPPASP